MQNPIPTAARHNIPITRLFLWLFLLVIGTNYACTKEKDRTPPSTPTITAVSTTSSSITLSVNATDNVGVTKMELFKADGTYITAFSGGSGNYTITGLATTSSISLYATAYDAEGNMSKSQAYTFSTTSSLLIKTFEVSSITAYGAKFTFAAEAVGSTIVSQTLTNNVSGEVMDVTNLSTKEVTNLNHSTAYTFTLTVRDDKGVVATGKVNFTTPLKPSAWISSISATYGKQFAIEQNALSDKLTISIVSTAAKTLSSLTANFGANGSAVKMLRYLDENGKWVVLKVNNGEVVFSNIKLASGTTNLECYFSIKVNAGVANNSKLDFTFTKLNDGEGAEVPAYTFPATLPVGTVNASTEATVITSDWWGYMDQTPLTLAPSYATPNPVSMYNVTNVRASGPAGARWGAIKLRNPYGNQIYFDNTSWNFADWSNPGEVIPQNNVNWNNDDVLVLLPNGPSSKIKTSGFTSYIVFVKIGNSSSTQEFKSTNTTPHLFGFQLMSKYDIVIYNSDNQVVDLSDVVVKQGASILSN